VKRDGEEGWERDGEGGRARDPSAVVLQGHLQSQHSEPSAFTELHADLVFWHANMPAEGVRGERGGGGGREQERDSRCRAACSTVTPQALSGKVSSALSRQKSISVVCFHRDWMPLLVHYYLTQGPGGEPGLGGTGLTEKIHLKPGLSLVAGSTVQGRVPKPTTLSFASQGCA